MRYEIAANFDVVVIGSGISGLICAIELANKNKSVCILTKEAVTESSSLYAQGGIAIPLSRTDSFEKHLDDTLKAGTNLCNIAVSKEIIKNSLYAYEKLISYGVRFDLKEEGLIDQTKEAAHSEYRVCHIGGDATGRHLAKILIDKACRNPNISISQGTTVLSILKDEQGNACGVLAEDITHYKYVIFAKDIIVASGGAGQLFFKTTNPKVCTGDGIAISYKAGANLQDLEMIQFHPTVFQDDNDAMLITEAVRGEGGKLKNTNGEFFASKYHKYADLAPRDILSRAILSEITKTNSSFVYLDVNNFKPDYFKARFPTVWQFCDEKKIDLFNKGIPVSPAAHYCIGGVKSDAYGRTSIPCLWVVGEASSSGFHGANRLASNSLLECIVVPHLLVKNLLSKESLNTPQSSSVGIDFDKKEYGEKNILLKTKELQLKNTLVLGLVREGDMLKEHLEWLSDLMEEFHVDRLISEYKVQELKNMILLSFLTCNAALERKHSLGVHYRADFQELPLKFEHTIVPGNSKKVLLGLEKFQEQLMLFS